MAVRLRLTRLGAKKRPFYRVVATDQHTRRDGRHIEFLGYYNPKVEPIELTIDLDRVDYWRGVGAPPSDTGLAGFPCGRDHAQCRACVDRENSADPAPFSTRGDYELREV